MNMKKLLKRNEFYVILIIVVLSLLIQMKSGQFFTANNIVDLVRSLIVPGMMAAGLFMVIASGNIDVSFPYTAMLCMFAVTKWFQITGYDGPVIVGFLAAGLLGAFLGLINGVLAAWLKLPTLIITLGTCSIYLGFTSGGTEKQRYFRNTGASFPNGVLQPFFSQKRIHRPWKFHAGQYLYPDSSPSSGRFYYEIYDARQGDIRCGRRSGRR